MRKRIRRRWKRILAVFLLLYFGALLVPYIPHKDVPEEFQKQFSAEEMYGEKTGTERVAYVTDNQQALLLRLSMMEEAREEIILSTFEFRSDESGRDVMAALFHAADRGVNVRVIIDGISDFRFSHRDPYFLALASHENVQIRIYNPVNFLKPWKVQARLHDKYVIVDDRMYLLGGRNTYDLFLGEYSDTPNIDRELFVWEEKENADSSLNQVRDYFERVWSLTDSRDFLCGRETEKIRNCRKELEERYISLTEQYPSVAEKQDWKNLTMETNKVTLLSNPIEPKNKEPLMWYCLTELMKTGKQVTIYTPYIICGKEMYDDLEAVCHTVPSVEIITNDVSGGANPFGCSDYLNQKSRIWDTGVQVY